MRYHTIGFIAGVEVDAVNTTILFQPVPPFSIDDDKKLCMLRADDALEAKFLPCNDKMQCKVSFLRLETTTALLLMQNHQKIRIATAGDNIKMDAEWQTV